MPGKILTGTDYYGEIRARLGVDDQTLANAEIDTRSILPIAEARVISRVPDYASLSGDDSNYCYAAAICMTAAILAPGMPARIKASEGDSEYKYTNASVDWRKKAVDLEDEAYSYIDYISTQGVVELTQFAASGPTRANTSNSDLTPNSADIILYPNNAD